MKKSKAIRQIKFSISMMTKRFSVDTIKATHILANVDIDTSDKVRRLKGRLAASVQADLAGSLNKTTFMGELQFTTTSTVKDAGRALRAAYLAAWSPTEPG